MSRDTILSAVRAAALGRPACEIPVLVALERAMPPPEDMQNAFVARLEACGVCVERLADRNDVPVAALRYITAARLPLTLRHGHDPQITSLPWDTAEGLHHEAGAASAGDLASLSRALSGIAETGTLLLASGPDNPVTLAFLPDLHIVVLDQAHIVQTLDAALIGACSDGEAPRLPRTINLISGASRTGDIGGRLVMGAHGPRQLVVLIVKGTTKNGASESAV
jgi:L-lactate dehydrogenase complex protein LldG